MKVRDILTDAATVAGCCIGVGFISGKEAQMYIGNPKNIAIFALCFGAVTLLLRSFCAKNNCFDVATLSRACFKKGAGCFTSLFCACSFVCVVTVLAGVQNCLDKNIWKMPLPLYGTVCALLAFWVLKKGIAALKILNAASVTAAFAYLTAICLSTQVCPNTLDVAASEPVKYALFSVTMSLGVVAPMSVAGGKRNVAATIFATLLLATLITVVLFAADFSLPLPILDKGNFPLLNIFGGTVILLASATGVAANTLPILQNVSDVFCDDNLALACIFCLALALSLFGFDFALRYGYLFVTLVGLALITAVAAKTLAQFARKKFRKGQNNNFALRGKDI